MASITKKNHLWRAQICVNATRLSKSFRTKSEAVQWAKFEEDRLKDGGIKMSGSVGDLLRRYQREISPLKKGERFEVRRLNTLLKESLANVRLADLGKSDVVRWRDESLQKRKPASVYRDMNLLSSVFRTAVNEWEALETNPLKDVRRPSNGTPRDRVPTQQELDALIKECEYVEDEVLYSVGERLGAAILFACQTGMRAQEIAGVRPELDKGTYIHLPAILCKNGHSRNVALTAEARRVLDQVASNFELTSDQISANFMRIKKKIASRGDIPEINTLRFHDLRAYALTKLAQVLQPMELAKLSGHRDLQILLNTYYRQGVDEVAAKLNDITI